MIRSDFLVIGSGIAGLTYAIKTALSLPKFRIVIVTKSNPDESNTKYAQGGIAVVLDLKKDSFEQHIKDTLIAGDGLCDKKVVEIVVTEGPKRIKELLQWGVDFDKKGNGHDLGREGGHSVNRVIHHGDSTGLEIEKKLLAQVHELPNIHLLDHHFAMDLIMKDDSKARADKSKSGQGTCEGVFAFDQKNNKVITILSKITLIATGGAGQVFKQTTNPLVTTGDGVAMAYRAGARIKDMEFIQYHPTALYKNKRGPSFLISEAVRGAGAQLRTKQGSLFMRKYDPRKELASRDIVARAINRELEKTGDPYVLLDCKKIKKRDFLTHFPTIYEKCISQGIDPFLQGIPVVPAVHYFCGGIETDLNGYTSIKNLYASGESACTGLHGANRLASNSLLEALVFAHRAYKHSLRTIGAIKHPKARRSFKINSSRQSKNNISKKRKILQETMNGIGLISTDLKLSIAFKKINHLLKEINTHLIVAAPNVALLELRNLAQIAFLVLQQSMERTENKGVFFNSNNLHRTRGTKLQK